MLIRVKLDLINWLLIYKNDYVSVEIINKLNAGIEGMLEKEGGRAQQNNSSLMIFLMQWFWSKKLQRSDARFKQNFN